MMSNYIVKFYQCGTYGIESEAYKTKREAQKAASGFISAFGRVPGHKRQGNIAIDGYTRLIDYSGATEAMASVSTELN